MDLSDRTYMNLSASERLRATIAAQARGDEAEFDRLLETCPLHTYRMQDAQFSMALKGAAAMSAMHQVLTLRMMVGYLLADRVIFAVERAAETKPDTLDTAGYDVACQLSDTTIACLKARQEAWAEFCGEVGVTPGEMAGLLQVGMDDDIILSRLEAHMRGIDVEADGDVRRRYLKTLRDAWEGMQ